MTDEDSGRLNRRSVLAGIGAAGAGAALGGFGTSALFTDEGNLDNNEIVAGELNLVVDWREQYDMGEGMRLIDVFPDTNNAGEQDDLTNEKGKFCEKYGDIDDPLNSKKRSIIDYHDEDKDYITDGEEADGEPLVYLDDVKPGDCWKTALSYHLCGNDGWVWFRTRNKEFLDKYDDNKPEDHLADRAWARVWYDMYDGEGAEPGDGIYQSGKEPIITQGSLRDVLNELNDGVLLDADPSLGPVNGEDSEEHGELECVALDKTDNQGQDALEENRTYTFHDDGNEIEITITDLVRKDDGDVIGFDWESNYGICQVDVFGGTNTNEDVYEGCVFEGSASSPLNPGGQVAGVSNFTFYYCPNVKESEDEPENDDPACTEASNTHYIGFEWCLPLETGNEIQQDRLEFDLQFYTEQCRHNDDPQNPFVAPDSEADD